MPHNEAGGRGLKAAQINGPKMAFFLAFPLKPVYNERVIARLGGIFALREIFERHDHSENRESAEWEVSIGVSRFYVEFEYVGAERLR